MTIGRENDRWKLDGQRASVDEILVYTQGIETLNVELQVEVDKLSQNKTELQSTQSTSEKVFGYIVGGLAGLGILTLLYWVWNFRGGIWTGITTVIKFGLIALFAFASMAVLVVLVGLVVWFVMKVIKAIKNRPPKEEREQTKVERGLDLIKNDSQ